MSEVYEFKPKSDRKRRAEAIDVVRKLLAETVEHGCTEAEALAYAEKAQAMMADHDITMADIEAAEEKEKPHEDDVVDPTGHPMPNVRRFLAAEFVHPDHCLLLHQGGQFYRWDGTCWPALEDPILR